MVNNDAKHLDDTARALITFSQSDAAENICKRYLGLLEQIDAAFAARMQTDAKALACHPGCCDCCHGIFEISILDLMLLCRALVETNLEPTVFDQAGKTSNFLNNHGWVFPHWWHSAPEENDFEQLDNAPCPLLDRRGRCRIYSQRPSICRFQGMAFFDPAYPLDLEDDCPRQSGTAKPASFRLKEYYDKELELFHELTYHLTRFKTTDMGKWDAVIAGFVYANSPRFLKRR